MVSLDGQPVYGMAWQVAVTFIQRHPTFVHLPGFPLNSLHRISSGPSPDGSSTPAPHASFSHAQFMSELLHCPFLVRSAHVGGGEPIHLAPSSMHSRALNSRFAQAFLFSCVQSVIS